MKMEQTEYSEMSTYNIQTPGNYPEESIKHSEHGENFKSKLHVVHTKFNVIWDPKQLTQVLELCYNSVIIKWIYCQ